MHNTRTRARVSRFTRYYHVTCDMVFREQFIFVLHFLLVNSTIPRLARQPRLVARREVPGGGFLNLGRSNLRWTASFNIYRRRPIYGSFQTVHSTLKIDSLSASPFLHLVVPSFAVQRIEGERCLRTDAGDLHGSRRIMFLGSALARLLACSFRVFFIDDFFIYSCTGSTVSRSPSCSWYNGDLMDRSVVSLSHLCCFLWSDLDLCSTSVVHVNC
jgi:hypothetical protein